MENIDNWEVIPDEQMGAYLSDKRDSINISGFDDGIDARYSYETEVEKKDYRDYFGKIQHHYQDLKRNPLSSFSRGAWNSLLALPKGLGDAIIGAGEYVAFKTTDGDPEFEKKLAEGANALRAKNANWFKQYEYITDQKDNRFAYDLGSAGGSLVSALGLSFVTKNPSIVAGAFGASQFGSINKELRERGVDIDRAFAISTGLGIAEGALERIGLHLWFENAATKKISSYLLKQGATEFTQEASQTAVEEVTMKLLGERNTEWFDIVKDVIYTGVIGGIVGVGGGAVSIPSTEAFKKQAKERLVEKGFTEEKAQQLVDDAAYNNDEARRDLLELVNKEADQSTLLNGSYEDDVKAFNEAMQKDIVAEAFDIKQQLKATAMTEGGLDEETAEVASTLVENFTKVMYNETGQTPLEQFEEQGLTIIDERFPSPQDEVIDESELTEEEIARLDAREKEEFDIPFQTDQLRPGDEGYNFSPESDNIYYQSDDRELVVTHGTTLKKLEDALELGAMPMPSLTITKYQNVNNQYGEILFVGGSDVLKGDSAFAADIYSTRRVYPEFSLNKDGDKFIENITDKYSKKGKYFWISNIESELERGGNGYMLKALYLAEKGELTDLDGSIFQVTQDMTDEQKLDFSKWEKDFVKKYTDKKILTGYTPSGNKKYVSYDLANVLNIMKKSNLRGSENISSGNIHALRGVWAKELKTIEEIKKEKGRLSDNETYKKFTEAMEKDADNLINLLMTEEKAKDLRASYINYYDYVIDEALMLIKPNSNIKNILKKAELRSDKEAVDAVKNFIDVVKATPAKYFEAKPQRAVDFYEFNGVILPTDKEYDEVANKLSERGLRVVRSDNQKQALQEFNDVFFQGRTVRRGSYNPTTQVIRLFKEANPSTIIHELGHFFTMKYVKALEETGQQEKLAGFYNWLGINSIDEATTETWEKMARGFETYALEGVAPNVSTESVFQRMKQWLIGVYQDLKGKVIPPEEINDDVREFFDGMLASEQAPIDVSNIKGRTDDLINIINAAMKGEEVSIDGLSIKDVKELIKASNARLPRLPKNLEQAIRAAGGIDIQLAKSLGLYDERKGNLSGFFKEGGAFTKEDSLIEFLRDEGFLSTSEAVTYEQTAEITDRAISLLENASQTFRESDLGTVQQRESLAEAAQEASKLLQKIDYKDVQQAINTLRDKSISAVQNETLKYIKARLNRIDKDYRKVMNNSLRSQRKDIAQKQTDIINYIKEQPISNDHKFRLINEVKKTNSEETYEKAVNEVQRRAAGYYEQEQKKLLATQIKKEIKKSKPKKVTEQRYDYETNKLFQTLREYNKFTQELASAELEKFIGMEEPTNIDLIKMRFLNYKANGMSSSTQLMEKVLDDILQAKRLGTMLKNQADMEAAINKEQLKQDVLSALEKSTADEDKLKTRFTNLYRRGFANLYSLINSIASRKLAERFEMETVLNDADVTYYKHTDNLTKKVMGIFGVKSRGDLLNKFADMGEVIDTIYAENGNRYDLTKLDIVDIYNAIKNEKTRENYLFAYGEEQVMRFVNMLTKQERLFADLLMEDINSLYPETNKVYVETYGMDLKKVENYWPATSDRIKETDLLGDFYRQQETPSFYKERVKTRVTPLPKNAWEKYLKHVNESIYMVKVARKYKELSDTFKSSRVRNMIENKYGKGVYRELLEQINSISLNAKSESLNYVESIFGSMLNNFVVAKIAVAPTVFAGQLTSITNYSEEVNAAEYYKNFAYGLAHPKEVISFMKKNAGNFLETRYKGGYSEALSRVQREAENASRRKFKILSDKTKYNVTNALTSFVRLGDLGALMFGGYAQIQTNLNAGMKLDDAIKKFEFDTLRSQQSSNAASLSSFQKSTGLNRIVLAFKNTQHQYFRKIVDSIIQYQRGEISSAQCAKTILNYAVIQGSLYIIAKNAVKMAIGLGDDDDELTDGLLEQIMIGNLDAIPFLSDLAHFAYKIYNDQYVKSLISMPGLDDIEMAGRKMLKEDKTIYDWVDIIAPLIEGTTGAPVKRYAGMLKKYLEDE